MISRTKRLVLSAGLSLFLGASACSPAAKAEHPDTAPAVQPVSVPTAPRQQSTTLAAPVALATQQRNATAVALDATHVYWTGFSDIEKRNGVVMKVPKAGGPAVVLAAAQLYPARIAVDDENVYWTGTREETVRRVARSGGEPVAFFSGKRPEGIAVDETSVYVTDRDPGFRWPDGSIGPDRPLGVVWRIPKEGGAPEKLAERQKQPTAIAVSNGGVVWLDLMSVVQLRDGVKSFLVKDGGCRSPLSSMAMDDVNVYSILCIAKPDASEEEKFLLSDLRYVISAIARDGSGVQALVMGRVNPPLAVDQTHVYFTEQPGKVLRVAKTGGDPEVVATWGEQNISGMAADESGVYFSTNLFPERPLGDIVKLARIPEAASAIGPGPPEGSSD